MRQASKSAAVQLPPISQNLPIAIVLLLSFGLNITGINWGLPNYVDWALDSTVPFDMLEAAYYRFSRGWANIYPPFHYAVQAALSAPMMAYLVFTGGLKGPNPIFPFGFSDPLSALTHIILLARVLSVIMGVGIVLLIYRIVDELFDRHSALFSALIITLYYPLIYYAHNANTDVPYLFWSSLAIFYFVRILKEGLLTQYVLFALFATLAICTKDQAYGLFLLSPVPILWARYRESVTVRHSSKFAHVLCDRRLFLAGLVAVGTFVLGHNLLFNFAGFLNHVRLITGPASESYASYAPTLAGRVQLIWATVSELALGLTLPVFALCLIGSLYCAFQFPRSSLPLLFLAATYHFTFINVVRYVPLRFVLPIAIIMSFFGGKLASELWRQERWRTLARAALCLALAYTALFAVQLNILFLKDPRYAAEQWLNSRLAPGDVIETFAPNESFFKHYPRFPLLVHVRMSRLSSGTEWEVREIRPDRKVFPNLYSGQTRPDYVVLSSHWYRRFLTSRAKHTEQAQILEDFFHGRTKYNLVATFKTLTFVPIHGLTINPRIDIFARSNQSEISPQLDGAPRRQGRDVRPSPSRM